MNWRCLLKQAMGNISLLLKAQELEATNTCTQFPLCPARGFNNSDVRLVLKNRDGEASFDLPEAIPASSPEDIKTSSFRPEKPSNLTIQQHGDKFVLSWDPSECATNYLLRFEGTNGEEFEKEVIENTATITEFEGCSHYDVFVTAVAYGLHSDEENLGTIYTNPSPSSIDNLDPIVFPSTDSVTATWVGHSEIYCVSKYDVKICKEDVCGKAVTVETDPDLSSFEFRSTEKLEQCSNYTMSIKPLYKGTNLGETVVPFTTLSALEHVAPENFSVRLNTNTNANNIYTDCATGYTIYKELDDSEEDVHRDTKNNSISLEVGSSSLVIIMIAVVALAFAAIAFDVKRRKQQNPQNPQDAEHGDANELAILTNPGNPSGDNTLYSFS